MIYYVAAIVISLFAASVLLTLLLLAPLRQLIAYLKEATAPLESLKYVRPLPAPLTHYSKSAWARSDEFAALVNTVQKLIDRINLNYKLKRSWALQMAHEFKTPLAIIRAETESHKKQNKLPEKYI